MDREQVKAIEPEEFEVYATDGNSELWCPGYGESCLGPAMQADGETLAFLWGMARDHIQRWHDTSI